MNLCNICDEISVIVEKLSYGQISFEYDNLMSAMKLGHPADILDDILALVAWDVFTGNTPEREKVDQMLRELKKFKRFFKIKELNSVIKDLTLYLEGLEND